MTVNIFRDLRVWQAGMDLAFSDAIDQAVSLSRQLYALRNALVKRG
jgi:hypothetical protein